MTDAERYRQNRAYLTSRGLCYVCSGRNKVVPGKTRCQECADAQNAYMRERRKVWRADGRCSCGKALPAGEKYCDVCKARRQRCEATHKAHCASVYEGRKLLGMCVKCGTHAAAAGHVRCERCMAAQRAYNKTHTDYAKRKEERRQRQEAGLCVYCGKPRDPASKAYCTRCKERVQDRTTIRRIYRQMDKEAENARRRSHEYANTIRASSQT